MSILKNNIQSAIQTLTALESLEPSILAAAKAVGDCMLSGGKLLVCGNGGSAADGADFSTEFTCRFVGDRRPYPAIDLSSGSSLVTATTTALSTSSRGKFALTGRKGMSSWGLAPAAIRRMS